MAETRIDGGRSSCKITVKVYDRELFSAACGQVKTIYHHVKKNYIFDDYVFEMEDPAISMGYVAKVSLRVVGVHENILDFLLEHVGQLEEDLKEFEFNFTFTFGKKKVKKAKLEEEEQ